MRVLPLMHGVLASDVQRLHRPGRRNRWLTMRSGGGSNAHKRRKPHFSASTTTRARKPRPPCTGCTPPIFERTGTFRGRRRRRPGRSASRRRRASERLSRSAASPSVRDDRRSYRYCRSTCSRRGVGCAGSVMRESSHDSARTKRRSPKSTMARCEGRAPGRLRPGVAASRIVRGGLRHRRRDPLAAKGWVRASCSTSRRSPPFAV
jgi:hypothetical protein